MTTTFETAQVGDRVWDSYFEEWFTILSINPNDPFPIITKDSSYTMDGRPNISYGRTLFWDEVKIIAPPMPLPKLDVDTKVLVWGGINEEPTKRYFSHFDENGKIATFSGGRTSWTKAGVIVWEYWELAKD